MAWDIQRAFERITDVEGACECGDISPEECRKQLRDLMRDLRSEAEEAARMETED